MAKARIETNPEDEKSPRPGLDLSTAAKNRERGLVYLNFRVPDSFHREFKLYAVQHGLSMVNLLQASFAAMKEKGSK